MAIIRYQLVALHLRLSRVTRISGQLIFVVHHLVLIIMLFDHETARVNMSWHAVVAACLHVRFVPLEGQLLTLLLLQDSLQLCVCQLHKLESLSVLITHIIAVLQAL